MTIEVIKRPLNLLSILVGLAPSSRTKNKLLCILQRGWRISPTAEVRSCLIVGVSNVEIGQGALIRAGNVIRGLRSLQMGKNSRIGSWNWITAAFVEAADDASARILSLASDSAITSRHYIDCTGGVSIREFATVAGVRSTFISHGIDIIGSRQSAARIEVGPYSIVSSNCKIAPGAVVPARSLVGMGSVFIGAPGTESSLYGGAPAQWKKNLPESALYFARARGFVI